MVDKSRKFSDRMLDAIVGFVTGLANKIKKKTSDFVKAKPYGIAVVVLIAGIVIAGFLCMELIPKKVTLVLDGTDSRTTTEIRTGIRRIDKLIETVDVEYDPNNDILNYPGYKLIRSGMTIKVTKPFVVYLKVDGKTYEYRTLGATVQEMLDDLGVELKDYDTITKKPGDYLDREATVKIQRVVVKYENISEKRQFEIIYVADSDLPIGETKVVQQGSNGTESKKYVVLYIDGKEISRTIVSDEMTEPLQNMIINYGTKILKGTPSDMEPIEELGTFTATAYNYSKSRRFGVYGMWCSFGTVAVDRKVIPLGSLLYIEGYGYAIANDVGAAIKGKKLDLYMEYRPQCSKWGMRKVKVYLIKEGPNTKYSQVDRKAESLKQYINGVLQYPDEQ